VWSKYVRVCGVSMCACVE